MKLRVRVIANAKENRIVDRENDSLRVKISAPAVEGKANRALIKLLAAEFKISPNRVHILKGERSWDKLVEIA
jgi:uncharacterized protein (TIGR00251 family)